MLTRKGRNGINTQNATMVTPNMKELSEIRNDLSNTNEVIYEYGSLTKKKYGFDYLLITRSEKGMSLVRRR